MKTINLLLGNYEGGVNNLIESLVRDVCDERAVLHSTRTARVDEFVREGSATAFDLAIVVPDNLLPAPGRTVGSSGEALRAITAVKRHLSAPVIAVSVLPQDEPALRAAGVDHVLELPFSCEELKATVNGLLQFQFESTEAPPVPEVPKTRGWLRGWLDGLKPLVEPERN